MNKKWFPYFLIALLAVAVLILKTYKNIKGPQPKTTTDKTDPAGINRNRGFDRRVSYLEYSRHAECRMDCRHISKAEVEDIMRNGNINYNKSDLQNERCPRYAVEGVTNDNQRVRIVYAQCDEKTEVVTVIDLNTEWECACPGDDNKYKNK